MKRIVVGLSGGVDSAVTAYLLSQEGYEVTGVTLCMHDGAKKEAEDAAKVASSLSIPHVVLDLQKDFSDKIIRYFRESYEVGETPNPCMVCNPEVKFKALFSVADSIGAQEVATGHYAGVLCLPNGRYTIKCAASAAKDQAYVLYRLSQEQLRRIRMPLCGYEKETVRSIAKELSLPVAEKADSMEICFIQNGEDYTSYLQRTADQEIPGGNFVSEDGEILGRHKGIPFYTVGQRKGLGIAFGEPKYVKELRPATGEVVLSGNEALFQSVVYAKNVSYMGSTAFEEGKQYLAKIRYSHKGAPCTVKMEGDLLLCEFQTPQRAVTPGQAIVLFDENHIAGGAVITKTII